MKCRKIRFKIVCVIEIEFRIGYSTEDLLHLVEIGEIGFTITDENIASALSISMKNLTIRFSCQRCVSETVSTLL